MKLMKKTAVFLLSLGMLAGRFVPVQAADQEYTYTVRFFSGAQGTILGEELVTYEGLNYGDRVTFNQRAIQLKDNNKYYIKGVRQSGRDNNTAQGTTSFVVTEDQDYVVVYGVLGNAVAYTVRYQDEAGNPLADDETYYGNVGDEPVLAYLYIDGYQPQAYNLTATLKENAADNIFTFVYTPTTEAAGVNPTPAPGAPAAGTTTPTPTGAVTTPPAGTAAPGGAAAPGGTTATPGGTTDDGTTTPGGTTDDGTTTPGGVDLPEPETPQDLVNLDNQDVPLANVGGDYGVANMILDLPLSAKAGIFSGAVLLTGGGVWLYKTRKRKRKIKDA